MFHVQTSCAQKLTCRHLDLDLFLDLDLRHLDLDLETKIIKYPKSRIINKIGLECLFVTLK